MQHLNIAEFDQNSLFNILILVQEADVERLLDAVQLLASCVLDEFSPKMDIDRFIRSSLIAAVHNPTPKQVINILSDLLLKVGEMERERIRELLDAWQIAERNVE